MECVTVNKKEILSEANKLVSNGLRKAAIDLLLEYLESDPNSSTMLGTLGRAYLLDNQPEKAVNYLKRSLEVSRGDHTANNTSEYQSDDFDDDDMAFIELQADKLFEKDYSLEVDEPAPPTENKETRKPSDSRPLLSITSLKARRSQSDNNKNNIQITCRGRRKASLPNNEDLLNKRNGFDVTKKNTTPSIPKQIENDSTHNIQADTSNNITDIQQQQTPGQKSKVPAHIKKPNSTTGKETATQTDTNDYHSTNFLDDEDFEPIENGEVISNELFEDDTNEEYEEELNELIPASLSSLEEESNELSLDDFDDLDEFDELNHRETEEEVQDDGKISREARARQVAVEVLGKSDWDLKHLSLLQQIFIENGWSAARVVIEKKMDEGIQPEELALARKVRLLWSGNEEYWTTFHKIKHNVPFQQADAAYKNMSWLESFRIVDCFPSLPDIGEIYTFIDEVFDYWYNNKNLRRIFPAFLRFLKYRVDSMRRALPSETVFSFLYYVNSNPDDDVDRFDNSISPEAQELLELGLQLNQWPQPPENKMKILTELEE